MNAAILLSILSIITSILAIMVSRSAENTRRRIQEEEARRRAKQRGESC